MRKEPEQIGNSLKEIVFSKEQVDWLINKGPDHGLPFRDSSDVTTAIR